MNNSNIASGIARSLAKENEIDRPNGVDSFAFDPNQNVDRNLATIFYNFLTGKSNQLPTVEFIDHVKSLSSDELISVNCGVFVYRNLDIISIDLTKDMGERKDIITSDNYVVEIARENENLFSSKYIDPEKEPRFSKERVEIVQKFINEYKKTNNPDIASARR